MSVRIRVLCAFLCALFLLAFTMGAIYALGVVLWQADGVRVSTPTNRNNVANLAPDGSDGVIVTWEGSVWDMDAIRAQRVYSNGTKAWSNDVQLCTASIEQYDPQITSDGEGGATVTWEDLRSGSTADIYAQRVYSDGSAAWTTDGVSLCVAADNQIGSGIVTDGEGGAIVTWEDRRGSDRDIYAQRVYSDGTTAWATDGAGGAIVTWYDYRSGTNYDVYAQRVYSDGTAAWTTDGVSLCAAAGGQWTPQIVSDGAGGAIVTWRDYRSGTSDIYAQRVDQDGNVIWQANGLAVCLASGSSLSPKVTSDGRGGAILIWDDGWSPPYFGGYVFAQRLGTAEAGSFMALMMKRE